MSRITYKKNVRIEITQKITEPGAWISHNGNTHWQEQHEAKNMVAVADKAMEMAEDIKNSIRRHVDLDDAHMITVYEVVNACGFCLDETPADEDRIPPCCDEAQKEWLVTHTAEQAAEQDRLDDCGTTYQDYRLELLLAVNEEEQKA